MKKTRSIAVLDVSVTIICVLREQQASWLV